MEAYVTLNIPLKVYGNYTPGKPARLNCHPDLASPPEPPEWNIEEIETEDGEEIPEAVQKWLYRNYEDEIDEAIQDEWVIAEEYAAEAAWEARLYG